jgi:hypothetical protein
MEMQNTMEHNKNHKADINGQFLSAREQSRQKNRVRSSPQNILKMYKIDRWINFIMVGIVIRLSSGFGMLLFGQSAIFLVPRWKRDIQKKLRRKYFQTKKDLLLEQLASADENASEKTKIFLVEELKGNK